MEAVLSVALHLRTALVAIQNELEFRSWARYPAFNTSMSLGRVGLIGCGLGGVWGIHFLLLVQLIFHRIGLLRWEETERLLGQDRIQLLMQYAGYVVLVCSFHMAEFFTTAVYNPSVLNANSFIISQSPAYTAAAILSVTEFWIRFWFFPGINCMAVMFVGLCIALPAQAIRTMAMVTCGESFNHLIQLSKKDNHVLIKHGIYKYLRHPSYVGFYYWSVGTQLFMCNIVTTIGFALAALRFFQIRIPYEEETLLILFGDEYADYLSTTYIGIPFVTSGITRWQREGAQPTGSDVTATSTSTNSKKE